jgi:lactose/L-arabinose transport system substrate-binding protein
MINRRMRLAGAAVAAMGLLLTACGDDDEESPAASSQEPSGDDTQESENNDTGATEDLSGTITVWTWEQPGEALQSVVPAFEEMYPGVTVDVQNVGNPAIWEKVTTGLAAGGEGLADVIHMGKDYIGIYMEQFPEGLVNLDEYGADELASNFNAGQWQQGSNTAGDTYGLPFAVTPGAFFYRADIFDDAGIDINSITTWDQLIDVAVDLNEETGIQLLSIDKAASADDAANLWQVLAQLGGSSFFNGDGQITMNNESGVHALTLIKEMNDAGLLRDVPGGSLESLYTPMGENQVLVSTAGAWMAGLLPDNIPDMSGQWKVRTFPAVDEGGVTGIISGGGFLSIANTSPNRDAAWEFVRFALADSDAQKTMYDAAGLFPAYSPMYETEGFLDPMEFYGGQAPNEIFVEELAQDTTPVNYTSDYARALKAFTDAQTQVLLEGADPKAALDGAAEQLSSQTGREIAEG